MLGVSRRVGARRVWGAAVAAAPGGRLGGPGAASALRGLSTSQPKSFDVLEIQDRDAAPYARSVKRIGKLLGAVMAEGSEYDQHLLECVERFRLKAKEWRELRDTKDEAAAAACFEAMVQDVAGLDSKKLRDVARGFAHFLALQNAVESEHRRLRLEATRTDGAALFHKIDSCAGTVDALIDDEKFSMDQIVDRLSRQKLEIVLTAHPTEVHRRTLLAKHRTVSRLLKELDDENLIQGSFEHKERERELSAVVRSLWGSDELRRTKPTPQKEARAGLAVIETSLWDAAPKFLRRLDATLKARGGALPIDAAPLKLASWMGGDRDGNPNVTAPVTREVVATQRKKGAELFVAALGQLRSELSITRANTEVMAMAAAVAPASNEPYKAIIEEVMNRLVATESWADCEIAGGGYVPGKKYAPLFDTDELLALLMKMYASLTETGYAELAAGRLADTIRRTQTFGLQLAPLDVRQESGQHAKCVAALRKAAGLPGDYLAMSDDEKIKWLEGELVQNRPLLRRGKFEELMETMEDPVSRDTLATCRYMAEAPPGAFGAYVISHAKTAADVLAVELLLAEAGVTHTQRVAPLFETLKDLNNAPDSLRRLFSVKGYCERHGNKQEIMVGYSDSAKDAGRVAAAWALFEQQEKMLAVAKEFGVEPTFFHGKGGSVGRGGNPAVYKAILSHPPDTIDGRYRITEQGEMIGFNFGEQFVAERSLDVHTAAVLRDSFASQAPGVVRIKPEWRAVMAKMAEVSCDAYRSVVSGHPDFVPYFRTATPEKDLASLNLGSRPAKRNPTGGVESLRAIPWIFAWTQTRLNLPAWLGVGKALTEVDMATVKEMYASWPWFKTNLDVIELLLAKTEARIAEHYDKALIDSSRKAELALGAKLREDLAVTLAKVLTVSGHATPSEDNGLLQRALALRNPYVDVLNVLQVEALKRARKLEGGKHDPILDDALLVTVNGIAAGLRNSG